MKRRLKENIEIGDEVYAPRDEYKGTVVDINGDEVLVDGPFGEEYHNLSDLEKLGGDYEEDLPPPFRENFTESRKKIIRLTERDLARIVKRVIKENEDEEDENFWDRVKLDFGRPKDFTAILSDISDIIWSSEDVNDFKMKLKEFTKDNQKDFDNLTDDEKNKLDGFINNVITHYDFNS